MAIPWAPTPGPKDFIKHAPISLKASSEKDYKIGQKIQKGPKNAWIKDLRIWEGGPTSEARR
jgi:hypothetical protein